MMKDNNNVVEAESINVSVNEPLADNEEVIEEVIEDNATLNANESQLIENIIDPELLEEIAEIQALIEGNDQVIDLPDTAAGQESTSNPGSTAVGLPRVGMFSEPTSAFRTESLDASEITSIQRVTSAVIPSAVTIVADTSTVGVTASLSDATNSGLKTDNITSDNTPDIVGMTEAGATVVITNATGAMLDTTTGDGLLSKPTDTVLGTGTADENGAYSITLSALKNGIDVPLTVTATSSVSGNIATATRTITIDTVIIDPTGEIEITAGLTDATNSGLKTDNITNDNTPDIAGITEAGATVVITNGAGTVLGTGTADATTGAYSITLTELADGEVPLTVISTDVAGNTATATPSITIDTAIISPPTPTSPIPIEITAGLTVETNSGLKTDNITNDNTPDIAGITEAGATVVITNGAGTVLGTGTADVNGAYSFTLTELEDGEVPLTVTSTDVAGNTATATPMITIDTSANAGIVGINRVSGDNVINVAEINADTINVTGTATGGDISQGDAVTVTVNGTEYTTTLAVGGAYSVDVATADLSVDNTIDANVISNDVSGNEVTSTATPHAVTFDDAQVQITGVAITSSYDEVSIYSGAYLSVGASGVLNGGILTSGYTSIGASGTLGGNISSGGYTSTGAGAVVDGSVLSGGYVTTAAGSTIEGPIAAVAAITPSAGASQYQLDTSLVLSEQADAKQRVADAQDTLKAMEGKVLEETLGTNTLNAGVYEATNLWTVAGSTLTLDAQGLANQTWIFNVTSILALGANTKIVLINDDEGGASVIWNAHAGYASIGAGADILGTVYAKNYISVGADVTVTGPNETNGGLFTQSNYMTFGAGVRVGIAGDTTSAVSTNEVTGIAVADSLVTIHSENPDSDKSVVLGTVDADSAGNFTYPLTALNVITLAGADTNTITASIEIGAETVTSDDFTYSDELVGTYGNDTLDGTVGIDTIEGGIGDDILKGGDGDDYLIGGAGADTFIWQDGDSGIDTIKDFSFDEEGDKLDLSDILRDITTGDLLDEYLNFSTTDSGTTIDVFVEGNASASGMPDQKIILEGVDFSGSSDKDIINNLFNGDNAGPLIISDSPVTIDALTSELNEILE
jgi:hypothetical protein